MSGIAGIIEGSGRTVEAGMLSAMVHATPHLGIDGVRMVERDVAGMIRFELATTPEAVGRFQLAEHQPSSLLMAFDGRIDNRAELIDLASAEARGLPADATDCEIVLAAFRRLGDGVVERLVGDYALAVWNADRRRLFCARSPVGWRPLLWTLQGQRFAFATEPATLLRGLALERRPNEGAIAEHLASRFVTETETLWQGVYRLPPGHALAFANGQVQTWRWHEGPVADQSGLSPAQHVERFTELFDQALLATLRSAGPVAAHLSGGLDSSSVVCRTRQFVEDGRVAAMPLTVSARFPGEICDEGVWISAAEAQCGIRSAQVHGAAFDSAAMAQWCQQTLHLPLRPNTGGTLMATCDLLHQRGLKVLLTGEGGDDWLGGSFGHWPDLLRGGQWLSLFDQAFDRSRGLAGLLSAGRGIVERGLRPLVSSRRREQMLRPHLQFATQIPAWIDPDWARQTNLAARWQAAPAPPALASFGQAERWHVYSLARRHMNLDNGLAYAASRGVELRHPFHDLRLTRFLVGASGGVLRRHGVKKHLLREAMRGTLPEKIRMRMDKANISAPIIDGVAARLRDRPLRDLECVRRGWIRADVLETGHAQHMHWRNTNDAQAVPDVPYAPIWNAVAVDMWLENAFQV